MTNSDNAITRRVAMLSSQWLDFADDDRARILCWRLADDEVRMVDAFFALELDERTAEHADLFVVLESEFAAPDDYARALREAFVEQYDRERAPLREAGLEADWLAPEVEPNELARAHLLRTCTAFAAHHALPNHLVLVLRPSNVLDLTAMQRWLLALAPALPAAVRVIVFDAVSSPALTSLAEQADERVVARDADLDMTSADAEISHGAGKLDSPGGKYREAFLQLGAALGAQDLACALKVGDTALAVATSQLWFHMVVPVHAALGTALAAAKRVDESRTHFLAAEQGALRGEREGSLEARNTCKKLRMQSRLGLGAALIVCEEYEEAADVFEATVPIAAECHDDPVRLDCYRLAAFCHERANDPHTAFRWAYDGLQLAKEMPADALATSNLPYLGAALLGLCEQAGRESLRSEIEQAVGVLTGDPKWADAFAATSSAT